MKFRVEIGYRECAALENEDKTITPTKSLAITKTAERAYFLPIFWHFSSLSLMHTVGNSKINIIALRSSTNGLVHTDR